MRCSPGMSANPDDRLVTLLSRWLARHVSDAELRREVDAADPAGLGARPGGGRRRAAHRPEHGDRRRRAGDARPGDPRSARPRRIASLHVHRNRPRAGPCRHGRRRRRRRCGWSSTRRRPPPGAALGDSVAIDGCCLTVVENGDGRLAFDAVPETLSRTTLGRLEAGAAVNLEPALRAGEPLGGHIVQGHVDGVGRVRSLEPEGDGARLTVEAAPEIVRYCVEKGSRHRRRRLAHRRRARRRLLRDRPRAAHARRHHAGRARPRRRGQPRGRRAGEVRRAPAAAMKLEPLYRLDVHVPRGLGRRRRAPAHRGGPLRGPRRRPLPRCQQRAPAQGRDMAPAR